MTLLDNLHPLAAHHIPIFITSPGETDVLFSVTVAFVLFLIIMAGNLYLRLHSLPERLAHGTNRVQFQLVAVLGLLALFTHNNLYWVLALLLALVRIPDFLTPFATIANSLEKMANRETSSSAPQASSSEKGH